MPIKMSAAKNCTPDKVHPMNALTATKTDVFVIDTKTIPVHFHLTNRCGKNHISRIALHSGPTKTECEMLVLDD